MSGFYAPCSYCACWVPGDELAEDGACPECQGDECVRCHASDAEWASNLCLDCAESLGVVPLLALARQGLSVQLKGERLWGLGGGLWLIGGEAKLLLDEGGVRFEGGDGPMHILPLCEIVSIELCVQDAILAERRLAQEFHGWERRERQAEALFSHARKAAEVAVTDSRSAGSHDEPYEDDDDDEDWDWDWDWDATVAAGRAASERSGKRGRRR